MKDIMQYCKAAKGVEIGGGGAMWTGLCDKNVLYVLHSTNRIGSTPILIIILWFFEREMDMLPFLQVQATLSVHNAHTQSCKLKSCG